jgi:hypothetical protein
MQIKSLNRPTSPRNDERLNLFHLLGLTLVAIGMLLVMTTLAKKIVGYEPAMVSILSVDGESGPKLPHWQVPIPQNIGFVEWHIPETEIAALNGDPLAIELSGPFSAEIRINGKVIGKKGNPGSSATEEIAGPIDAVIAVPAGLLREGGNRVQIRYSSHHLNYQPASLLQGLRLQRYEADARRPLRYYVLTLIGIGAVVGVMVGLLKLGRRRNDRLVFLLAGGCALLLIAACAEFTLSLVNYAYVWHAPRQAIGGLSIIGFCCTLALFTALRWNFSKPAAIIAGGGAIAGIVGCLIFLPGFDAKTIIGATLVLAMTLGWLLCAGFLKDRNAFVFAVLPAALLVSAMSALGRFIDYQALILSVSILAYLLLLWPDLLVPKPVPKTDRIPVRNAGRVTYVKINEIVRLKAAGNYTEIHLEGGGWHLDQSGIGAVLANLPDKFLRVHKSHAVRLDTVSHLESRAGSRYGILLENGEELPVGRSKVNKVRSALA